MIGVRKWVDEIVCAWFMDPLKPIHGPLAVPSGGGGWFYIFPVGGGSVSGPIFPWRHYLTCTVFAICGVVVFSRFVVFKSLHCKLINPVEISAQSDFISSPGCDEKVSTCFDTEAIRRKASVSCMKRQHCSSRLFSFVAMSGSPSSTRQYCSRYG